MTTTQTTKQTTKQTTTKQAARPSRAGIPQAARRTVHDLDNLADRVLAGIEINGGLDWLNDAACAGEDIEEFFPAGYNPQDVHKLPAALDICAACPVAAQCLAYADEVGITKGIFAGKTSTQRGLYRNASMLTPRDQQRTA